MEIATLNPDSTSGAQAIRPPPAELPRNGLEDDSPRHPVVVTKGSVILALFGLAVFAFLYQDGGLWLLGLAAACLLVPLSLAVVRVWRARQGQLQLGLLRHPLRPGFRAHLLQGLNILLCSLLLGGVLAAGGAHYARVWLSLNDDQFTVVMALFVAGLVMLTMLALVPLRRVYLATNLVVVLLSGFLAVQLVQISVPVADAIVLDSPLPGEWFVQNGGRSALLNGHQDGEINAVDFQLLGADGRTHTGGDDAQLADYAGFGSPVVAPADGRVVGVTEGYPDNPPGTNGDRANHVIIDIGGDRYVVLVHVQQGSVTVQAGDDVLRGQPIATVGNNGHSSAPHLHVQVQDTTAEMDAEHTYPMVFRDVEITRGGAWPWGDTGELRTGDLVRRLGT